MGQIDQPLVKGSINKSQVIYVEPISAKNAVFSGDKSGDKSRTDQERQAIDASYKQRIVDALKAKGFNAKIASGRVKSGLVLSGAVTKFEHGSAAARIMVGMGAGSSNIYTTLQVDDRDHAKTLSKFEVIATSGGQGGIVASGSFMDTHMRDGAEKVATYFETSN